MRLFSDSQYVALVPKTMDSDAQVNNVDRQMVLRDTANQNQIQGQNNQPITEYFDNSVDDQDNIESDVEDGVVEGFRNRGGGNRGGGNRGGGNRGGGMRGGGMRGGGMRGGGMRGGGMRGGGRRGGGMRMGGRRSGGRRGGGGNRHHGYRRGGKWYSPYYGYRYYYYYPYDTWYSPATGYYDHYDINYSPWGINIYDYPQDYYNDTRLQDATTYAVISPEYVQRSVTFPLIENKDGEETEETKVLKNTNTMLRWLYIILSLMLIIGIIFLLRR